MILKKYLLTVTLIYMVIASEAFASIVSTTGSVNSVVPPASVDVSGSENSVAIIAFNEQQGLRLTSSLSVDYLDSSGSVGALAIGSKVNSYFIHFDPVGTSVSSNDLVTVVGSITFDTQISGLIYSGVACALCPATPAYLDASDYLGVGSTIYSTAEIGRGLELDLDPYYTGRGDFFSISTDGYTLDLSMTSYPLYLDQIRVITYASPVPVPAAVYLFFSGFLTLGLMGRKRKRSC